MFEENTDEPPRDITKAGKVSKYENAWYFYDQYGNPSIPFEREGEAVLALEDFSLYYEGN